VALEQRLFNARPARRITRVGRFHRQDEDACGARKPSAMRSEGAGASAATAGHAAATATIGRRAARRRSITIPFVENAVAIVAG
jgi:hypothetical protein